MNEQARQQREWAVLYERVREALSGSGLEDAFGRGDFWVLDENWGIHQHKVEVHNLKMLAPAVVESLRRALSGYPDWEIVVGVDVPGNESAWPAMGLVARHDKILDGLRRQYFPTEFQQLRYPGSEQLT